MSLPSSIFENAKIWVGETTLNGDKSRGPQLRKKVVCETEQLVKNASLRSGFRQRLHIALVRAWKILGESIPLSIDVKPIRLLVDSSLQITELCSIRRTHTACANLWQRVFPLWTLNWGKRTCKMPGNFAGELCLTPWELARNNSLAAGKTLVTGSKVPSDHQDTLHFAIGLQCTTLWRNVEM